MSNGTLSYNSPSRQASWHRSALFILALVIPVIIAYSNTFYSPFEFDDKPFILNDTQIRMTDLSISQFADAAMSRHPNHRPVPNLSFALNYYFNGFDVVGYHIVNLCLHLATGIFLFLFMRLTLRISPKSTGIGLSQKKGQIIAPDWIALGGALLWMLHPVNIQAVTYIVQRMTSLAAMFYILSMLLYALGRTMLRRTGRPDRLKASIFFIGAVFSGTTALLCKENSATLPVFIFLYEWFFFQDLNISWLKKTMPWIVSIILVSSLMTIIYLGGHPVERILSSYTRRTFTLPQRVMTEWRVVVYYISLFFYPSPSRLTLEYDYPISLSPVYPFTTIISLCAICALALLAIYSAKRNRLVSFAILWYLGNLIIESSVVGIEIIFEHRCYLPFMIPAMLFALAVSRLTVSRKTAVVILAIFISLCSLWTWERNQTWRDPVSLLSDCVIKAPEKPRPHNNLAIALYNAGRIDLAIKHFKKTIQLAPDNMDAYNNLGKIFADRKMPELAMSYYREVIRNDPRSIIAHHNMGNLLLSEGKYELALEHFEKAIRLNTGDPTGSCIAAGIALIRLHRQGDALRYFKKALKYSPDSADALTNIANIYAQSGNDDMAEQYYMDAIRYNPLSATAHANLGSVFLASGKPEEALNHFMQALKLNPQDSASAFQAGMALHKLGRNNEAIPYLESVLRSNPGFDPARTLLQKITGIEKGYNR